MIFTLEALEAKHGDALLLHYEEDSKRKIAVIDGGPPGVFTKSLKPRLEQLRAKRAHGGSLPLRLLMVSHIDDDHIQGIIDLARMVVAGEQAGAAPAFDFPSLWHNSFDDLVKKVQIAELDGVAGAAAAAAGGGAALPAWLKHLDPAPRAVAASVPQGRTLRQLAEELDCNLNPGFDGLIAATGGKDSIKPIGKKLRFTVLGPSRARLDRLQNDWVVKLAALKKAKKGKVGPTDLLVAAADYVDKSIYNLSSIVVLAESAGRRMLLTGDARGDDIIEGLREAKLLKNGRIHVDLLKVPHHGSQHNVKREFFETVTADHYVISADGKFGNPDPPMIRMLLDARGKSAYTVHLTNPVAHAVTPLKAAAKKNKGLSLDIRQDPALSVVVNLADPLTD